MRKGKGWKKGHHKCVSCGCWVKEGEHMIYDSDPYADEIHNDNTKVWECSSCRHESAMDI